MTLTRKNFVLALLVIVTISVGATYLMYSVKAAKAGSSVYGLACQTNDNGTTSPNYITAGRATTTLTCNLGPDGVQELALMVQLAGSSTVSTLNADIQYSQDGVDWYTPSLGWNVEENTATSSPSIGAVQNYTFTFASSTINRAALTNANSATSTRVTMLRTPTRYVRAVFYAPVGSAGAAFWAQLAPRAEIN